MSSKDAVRTIRKFNLKNSSSTLTAAEINNSTVHNFVIPLFQNFKIAKTTIFNARTLFMNATYVNVFPYKKIL